MKQVSLSKLFHQDSKVNHLTIWQLSPGLPFYVKCPKQNKDVMVARECIGCDGLRAFSYEKRYLDCRGKTA